MTVAFQRNVIACRRFEVATTRLLNSGTVLVLFP